MVIVKTWQLLQQIQATGSALSGKCMLLQLTFSKLIRNPHYQGMIRLSRPDPDDPTFRECFVMMECNDVPLARTQPYLEELSMGYNCVLDIIAEHVSNT